MLRKILVSATAALLVCSVASTAGAQVRSDRAVYFTFDQPVAIPGQTLPAGKYLFKLLDSQTNRSVVQVYNADGTKLVTMVMTIPAQRLDMPEDPEVRFMEGPANTPPAIRTWWYPSLKTGWEFIYPRSEAMKLAAANNNNVLTTKTEVSADEMKAAELSRVSAAGDQGVDPNAPAAPVTGNARPGQVATPPPAPTTTPAPVTTPAPTTTPAPVTTPAPRTTPAPVTPADTDRTSLPSTASATPLVLLIAAVALFGALAVRFGRRIA